MSTTGNTPVKIAILLLNYNGLRYLPLFFAHAQFLRNHPSAELIFIDNASIDDSIAWIREHAPWIKVIRNKNNYGFSEGYNQGLTTLKAQGARYSHYMFLNNDVKISEDWFNKIISAIKTAPDNVVEFGCRSVFMAPYIKESILSLANGKSSNVLCYFKTFPASSERKIPGRTKNIHVTAKIYVPPPTSSINAYYEIEISSRTRDELRLELRDGFEWNITTSQEYVTEINVRKNSDSHSNKTIQISPRNLVRIKREILPSELEHLPPIIQNSGIAINSRLEGYDLHCFDPVDTPQNHSETVGICGVCKTIRSDVFDKIGGFDKQIFMYYEDLDLSLRLKKLGYKSLLVSDAILIHDHSGSSNNHSIFFTRQVVWSLLYFHWRHGSLLRRIKTWLRYLILAHGERGSYLNPLRRPHELALLKFRATNQKHYLFGEHV